MMDLAFSEYFEHIFIGSSIMLSLMCLAWSSATRSSAVALIALFYLLKAISLLVMVNVSIFALFVSNVALLAFEANFFVLGSLVVLFIFYLHVINVDINSTDNQRILLFTIAVVVILCVFGVTVIQAYPWLLSYLLSMTVIISLQVLIRFQSAELNRKVSLLQGLLWLYAAVCTLNFIQQLLSVSPTIIHATDIIVLWLMVSLSAYLMGRCYLFQVQEQQRTQQQLLTNLQAAKVAQDELLQAQQESQEQLESSVQERTLELNIALQELEEVNKELRAKSTLDELTGLYNRRFYDQKIVAEFRRSKRNLTPLSLIIVDIDFFKQVNDNYGHLAGDTCLIEVAAIIKAKLHRSSDVGCRYGGEEFCLILPETTNSGAMSFAEEVRKIIAQQTFIYNDTQLNLTISCGVVTYTQQANITPEAIFASADAALYQAKQSGRNQVINGLLE